MSLPLPIDPLLPQAMRLVSERRSLVLSAEPGAGKTTRVPRALLESGLVTGEILVLEPRRLAARLAAERVAEEIGDPLGGVVGFQTRFERAFGPRTRIRFVTEGILTRRIIASPTLDGIGAVVLDELHERHLAGDLSLALLRRLQQGPRPDLRLVAMSATLETEPLARFLDAGVLSAPGRVFPITVEHLERADTRPLAIQVRSAVERILELEPDGHILVFLPGAREIRAAEKSLSELGRARDLAVLPLHGQLPVDAQNRAVRPGDRRKVILSTNVAETSVTIDGVVAVVDSGLALIAACAPWSGLPTLKLSPISKASATQRAGRAGRTRAGRCHRLFTLGDFTRRAAFETPEIARLDLSETLLELVAHGVANPSAFGWLEAPPAPALDAARELLFQLGALRGRPDALTVTDLGARMLPFPVHPRLSRMILEGEARGVSGDASAMAAIASERSFADTPVGAGGEKSDLVALLTDLDEAEHLSFDACRARGIDKTRAQAVLRVKGQLTRSARDRGPKPTSPSEHERALLISVLAGFPDRVGRLRRTQGGRGPTEIVFAGGGGAILSETSRARDADLVVAVDVEERTEAGKTRTVARLASAVEPDWLLELFTDAVVDEETLTVSTGSGRVESVRTLRFGQLVLDEQRTWPTDPEKIAPALADAILARGIGVEAAASLERVAVRLALVREHAREVELPPPEADELRALVRAACASAGNLREALAIDLAAVALSRLDPQTRRVLDKLVPDKIQLPGGRGVTVQYQVSSPPSIASRLQDFFGLGVGPSILGGRLPLVLHLCAPNQRPVQVTSDLSGFWERHYPGIAKELRRKYPRHAWPDDPRTASPPAMTKRR